MQSKTTKPRPALLFVADIHLSHLPPIARSAEPCWYSALERVLDQIKEIALSRQVNGIVIAGDLFDHWKQPPEMLTWCLKHFPTKPIVYGIPGQHDLPWHVYDDRHKGAYGTLVQAERIVDLAPGIGMPVNCHGQKVVLHGFPWGFPPNPISVLGNFLHVAVVHSYVWKAGCSFAGADESKRVKRMSKSLFGFDVGFFGDNHKGFYYDNCQTPICNCGALIRRSMDEKNYQPCVNLLYTDGSVKRLPLDCSEDRFLEKEDIVVKMKTQLESTELLRVLAGLEKGVAFDFVEAVLHELEQNDLGDGARKLILDAIGKGEDIWTTTPKKALSK